MRYLKAFGLIVLTAVLWNSGASAQNAPTGSYLQSCRDASTNGSTLYANCRNSYGEWQSVTLPDYQRCRGDIGNENGALRCDMRGNDYQPAPQITWQNGVPAGSYAQTCRDISVNGATLEATCQQRNSDNWTRTALQNFNQCTSGIENIDGQLECTKANYNPGYGQGDRRDNGQGDRRDNGEGYGRNYETDVPDGAYMQNCRNIRISGSTLLATCQQRNGRWRQASLRYYDQCTSEIENYNGRLVCRR